MGPAGRSGPLRSHRPALPEKPRSTIRPGTSLSPPVSSARSLFLAAVLRRGVPLGVACGVWAASGVALTAIAGKPLFQEPLDRTMGFGIVLIAAGVLLVEVGAAR